MSLIIEKFDVLNELNDEFKQRVKEETPFWP